MKVTDEIKHLPLIKFLDAEGRSCNGGEYLWSLPRGSHHGEWTPIIENPTLCHLGYHVVPVGTGSFDFLGPRAFEVKVRGKLKRDYRGHKAVAGQARLLRELRWGRREYVLFAALCAAHVLRFFDIVYAEKNLPKQAIRAAIVSALDDVPTNRKAAAAAWAEATAAWSTDALAVDGRVAWVAAVARNTAAAAAWAARTAAAGASGVAAAARTAAMARTAAELFGEPDAERAWQWACWCHLVGLEL